MEKHLTLARAMPGTDHAASLEPEGLMKMVRNIRSAEQMRWDDGYAADTTKTRTKLGRSLVTRRKICRGETVTEEDVCLKSPGDGIRWRDRNSVVGHKARILIPEDVTIQTSDVTQHDKVSR